MRLSLLAVSVLGGDRCQLLDDRKIVHVISYVVSLCGLQVTFFYRSV